MQIGLVGFPQTGKKTLLKLLTGVDARAAAPANEGPIPGICAVKDPRLERLAALYRPQKLTPATIQYLLLPDLTKESTTNQQLLNALALVDVLALVVRAFADDTVFHLDGSVDPQRDLEAMLGELLLNDLLFVEKRLERFAKDASRRNPADRLQEQTLFSRLQAHLNDNQPLRTLSLEREDVKRLSGAALLTRKPLLVILNVSEDRLSDRQLLEQTEQRLSAHGARAVQLSAKIEEELVHLDDPTERAAFLQALGITEPAIDQLTRVSYETLGLISYFTVGADEVRAWTVRRGASAAEAGGAIHSDIERGFIRAELIKYGDLIGLGSEQAVAAAGKALLKGKDYVVEDGDILNFRFNV